MCNVGLSLCICFLNVKTGVISKKIRRREVGTKLVHSILEVHALIFDHLFVHAKIWSCTNTRKCKLWVLSCNTLWRSSSWLRGSGLLTFDRWMSFSFSKVETLEGRKSKPSPTLWSLRRTEFNTIHQRSKNKINEQYGMFHNISNFVDLDIKCWPFGTFPKMFLAMGTFPKGHELLQRFRPTKWLKLVSAFETWKQIRCEIGMVLGLP